MEEHGAKGTWGLLGLDRGHGLGDELGEVGV